MQVTPCGQHQQWLFRCDDRNGFMLSILWASDGDLHISIVPDPDHENIKANCHYISGSVRIRVPFIGGGMYRFLHSALTKAMRSELAEEKKIEKAQEKFNKKK